MNYADGDMVVVRDLSSFEEARKADEGMILSMIVVSGHLRMDFCGRPIELGRCDILIGPPRSTMENFQRSEDFRGMMFGMSYAKFQKTVGASGGRLWSVMTYAMEHPVFHMTDAEMNIASHVFLLFEAKLKGSRDYYYKEVMQSLMTAAFYEVSIIVERNMKYGRGLQFQQKDLIFRRFLELTGREALFAGTREYPQLAGIVDAIMDEMRVKKSFYVEKVRGLLTALLFEIARITEREAAPHVPDSRVFGQISKALRYVDRHYAEPVRIGDLAEACSISETHFRRLFYEYIHMTPVEYLNMVRVLHACEILRSSNDTIAGVAVRCGFSTVSTLDRNFRQVLGVTPGQWKRDPKNYESKLLEVNVSVRKGW